MKCETYETQRVEASEAIGMAEHVADCPPCQGFDRGVQIMDRELPKLWAPALPADFASQVAGRARAERVLRPKAWYRCLAEDAADVRSAWQRTLGFGGLVGTLVGALAAVAVCTRYDFSHDGAWQSPYMADILDHMWPGMAGAVWFSRSFLPLTAGVGLLVAGLLWTALRPRAWWREWQGRTVGVGRVGEAVALLLGLLALFCAVSAVGVFNPATWSRGPSTGVEVLPLGLFLAAGSALIVGGVWLLMTRGVSNTAGQALTFYAGLGALYLLFVGWHESLSLVSHLGDLVRTLVYVVDPPAFMGWVGLAAGLSAAALTAHLVAWREPALCQRLGRWLLVLLSVLPLLALGAQGCILMHPPGWRLLPGPVVSRTFLTEDGPKLVQKTLSAPSWNSAANEAVLERAEHGTAADRYYALQTQLASALLDWNLHSLLRLVALDGPQQAGLGRLSRADSHLWRGSWIVTDEARDWAIDEASPWRQFLPADYLMGYSGQAVVGTLLENGRPLPGAAVWITIDTPFAAEARAEDVQRTRASLLAILQGRNLLPPGFPVGVSDGDWRVTDAQGHFAVTNPVGNGPGRALVAHLEMVLPGAQPVLSVHGLPVVLHLHGGVRDLGRIDVRRAP